MSSVEPPADLLQRLNKARRAEDRSFLVLVGSGVSVGATDNAPATSWRGLLTAGLAQVDGLPKSSRPKKWNSADIQQGLASRSVPSLIEAATAVEQALRRAGGDVYKRWLLSMFGGLVPARRELHDAIGALGVPLATTNYDGLLEYTLERQAVTWRDHGLVEKFLDGDLWRQAVLHLHGHYREPVSVVLGISSYEAMLDDLHAKDTLRNLFRNRDILFIGMGGGLQDPNFEQLLDWAAEVKLPMERQHWLLVRKGEVGSIMQGLPYTMRIRVQSYGEAYEDLGPFLRSLATNSSPAGAGAGLEAASAAASSVPQAVGQVQQVDSIHVEGSNNHVVIMQQTSGAHGPARPEPPRSEPLRPAAPRPQRSRPAWSALLQLDREHQYGKLLRDTIQDRASNRLVILHGQPEQNLALFIKRVEEYLRADAGCEVLNVPMLQSSSLASSKETWSLHLQQALEVYLGDSGRPVTALLRDASHSSPLLLALVAVDNPLQPLGVLSPAQRKGLGDFMTISLPKYLAGCRRIAVFVPIEHRNGDTSLLTEVIGWAEAAWHSDEENRSHTLLLELTRPSWAEVDAYLRDYRPPLPNLAKILQEARAAYDRLRPETTFEELARIIDDLVSLHR